MDDLTRILTIVSIVMFAGLAVITIFIAIKKRTMFSKLQYLLAQGQYDEFFRMIDSRIARLVYPDYNRQYFKLNAYIFKGDWKEANAVLDDLLARKVSDEQRRDLVVKAFNIYLGLKKAKKAKALLEEMESWRDPKYRSVQQDSRMMYDIAIAKSHAYIEQMEKQLEHSSGAARSRLDYLLAIQYENKGDKVKRDEYLRRSTEDAREQNADAAKKTDR